MDNFKVYIESILKGLILSSDRKKELGEEIRDHLEMRKSELVKSGLSEDEAAEEAIRRFGGSRDIKKRFRSVYNPYNRLSDAIKERKILKESLEWAATIAVSLLVAMSIRSYAFAQTEVRQSSMENTLYEGQRLVEYKTGYLFSAPQRGDIVVINTKAEKGIIRTFADNTREFFEGFYNREEIDKKRLIKRVIGVPGDTIDIRDGKVYINGKPSREPYVKGVTYTNGMKVPFRIPPKKYFVMGDNREISLDSRSIGLISADKIEGKAVLRLWPFNEFGGIYK